MLCEVEVKLEAIQLAGSIVFKLGGSERPPNPCSHVQGEAGYMTVDTFA
jgi:hypothetical protein